MMKEKAEAKAAARREAATEAPPYMVPAVSTEEVAAIQAKTPSNVIPFPSPALGEEKPAAEVVGVVEEKSVKITEKSIEEAKNLIESQQSHEHPLDTSQKIQALLPKVPGFCMIFQGAGVQIQRAYSAVKGMSQQVQEKVAQIFR